MKAKVALWKESASLIILAKDNSANKKFNYNILMYNRSMKTSFMPNHAVFPGGVKETVDESKLWLKYFKKFGIQDKLLNDLTIVNGARPDIFKKSGPNCIEKEIALRITAIRETFEEVGLFLCRSKGNLYIQNEYGAFIENFDRHYWQQEVHQDPAKFLYMCQELDVVPDLWSLYEWSAWLTPASFNKRFETAFYLVALNEQPSLLCEENEVAEYFWMNPVSFFEAYCNGKVWLPPPQHYELARLANFSQLESVQKFAAERDSKGSTLFLPVQYLCNNGVVGILPGDEYYPDNPNECVDLLQLDEIEVEPNSNEKKRHRMFNNGINKSKIVLNIEPFDGHLSPLDLNKIDSKL